MYLTINFFVAQFDSRRVLPGFSPLEIFKKNFKGSLQARHPSRRMDNYVTNHMSLSDSIKDVSMVTIYLWVSDELGRGSEMFAKHFFWGGLGGARP